MFVCAVCVCVSHSFSLTEPVNISLIGKYTLLSDAYLSVIKSLQHACMEARLKLKV